MFFVEQVLVQIQILSLHLQPPLHLLHDHCCTIHKAMDSKEVIISDDVNVNNELFVYQVCWLVKLSAASHSLCLRLTRCSITSVANRRVTSRPSSHCLIYGTL